MNKVFVGFGLSLFIACTPEFGAGKGERCDEVDSCGEGLECYRGFCVPESGSAAPTSDDSENEDTSEVTREPAVADSLDGGITSRPDAGTRGGEPTAQDASEAREASTGAQTSNTGEPSPPAVTVPPATTPDASAPQEAPKPGAKPPKSSPPAAVDAAAAAPVDAGPIVSDAAVSVLPDASIVLPKDCTLEECCAELARANGGSKEGKGEKGCGCKDPALLRTLSCVVVAPIGVLL